MVVYSGCHLKNFFLLDLKSYILQDRLTFYL